MRRLILVTLFLFFSSAAAGFQPRTGHWFNPNESGRGFNFDIQDGILVMTFYSYNANGDPQWYLASGPMTSAQHNFSAPLGKYRDGQCLSCAYGGEAVPSGDDGVVSINFTSETAATITLPGGRITQVQPFNFGIGDPPAGLLGEWVFVYDIIITFADRYDLTEQRAATALGNGSVWDVGRNAACELQLSGALGGQVACIDFNLSGAVANQYLFRFGLDETFSGSWVSPTSFNSYPMKGFKVKSKGGFTKALASDDEKAAMSAIKIAQDAASNGPSLGITEIAALMALGSSVRAMREQR